MSDDLTSLVDLEQVEALARKMSAIFVADHIDRMTVVATCLALALAATLGRQVAPIEVAEIVDRAFPIFAAAVRREDDASGKVH